MLAPSLDGTCAFGWPSVRCSEFATVIRPDHWSGSEHQQDIMVFEKQKCWVCLSLTLLPSTGFRFQVLLTYLGEHEKSFR